MKKKSIVCEVLASSVAIAATLSGCSLVSTNTGADMNQTIAVVDISKAEALDKEFENYKAVVGSTTIIKRELVAYFINYGYSYVQNYGYTYEKTFNTLLDALIENAVLVQYSTMYLLKEKATNKESDDYDEGALAKYEEASKKGDKEKYEYLLGGEDSDDVKIAKYNLYYSINSSIDSREKDKLKEKTSTNGTETRTTPGGVDTQKDDYYPSKDGKLDYGIYTGYTGYKLGDSGAYQDDALEGTTNATRIAAYNDFISNLTSSSYDLVDTKKEDLSKVDELNYIQYEYVNQLQQRIINKYYDVYEEKQEALLKELDKAEDKWYSTIDKSYQDLLGSQTENYKTESNFTSAMDSMSDTSFVLYAPEGEDGGKFGYVYNILLPFSKAQSDDLTKLQQRYADGELDGGYKPAYYVERNELLKGIKTTDQRSAWFNGETDYAFNAAEKVDENGDPVIKYYPNGKNSSWLFFENNVSNPDKYEALDKYAGLYPYNGSVVDREDGSYKLIPNELTIDDMLKEFVAYIDHVMGNAPDTTTYDEEKANAYGVDLADKLYSGNVNGKDLIDYSNFVYTSGKVNFGTNDSEAYNRANLLVNKTDENEASKQYLALSAVNELQYAYTTDTGVLSQYLGYSVQAGDTNYIKEFEYAAHQAVKEGAGTYYVCAGDYGWHLIYVTYTFDFTPENQGVQYTPDWKNNIDIEGTFENLFYEWYKSTNLSDISTKRRNQIITDFKGEKTVTKYESAYKNLLELDKN